MPHPPLTKTNIDYKKYRKFQSKNGSRSETSVSLALTSLVSFLQIFYYPHLLSWFFVFCWWFVFVQSTEWSLNSNVKLIWIRTISHALSPVLYIVQIKNCSLNNTLINEDFTSIFLQTLQKWFALQRHDEKIFRIPKHLPQEPHPLKLSPHVPCKRTKTQPNVFFLHCIVFFSIGL